MKIVARSGSRILETANVTRFMPNKAFARIALRDAVYFHGNFKRGFSKSGKMRFAYRGGLGEEGGLQCVPFARAASGIDLKGNAANWWEAASGVYERGARPELGSVLTFRSTGHMRLGHVAVVTSVAGPREIEIDHANWAGPGVSKGGVSRGMSVVDVSPDNDWSEVRVSLGRPGDYGSVYPTYGFIYDRPDSGVMMANDTHRVRLRSVSEVAEAPARR